MAKYGLLVGICALFTVLICLIKFPRDIFRYLIRMEEMRQSLKIIEQVSVQMKRESTDTQSQNVIFLLNVDNIFGPFQRVTYLWSYFVGLSLQPPPPHPTYPSPTPTAHPRKCYFY